MAQIPTSMQAYRLDRFGGPEVARIQSVPVPRPGAGELLVQVRAASVNPVDAKIREGQFPPVAADKLPYTLGRDLCGTVVARGPGVSRYAEGDVVQAYLGIDRGGLSEYAIVKETEAATKPKTLDDITTGAIPLAGITAWQGLFTHGGLAAGQRVLIHAGSGGVGHLAVQFAKAVGAHVTTTVSAANIAFAQQLGADVVIDHAKTRFQDEVKDVDLVFDLVGGDTREQSWGVLKPGGILVSTLGQPSEERAKSHGVRTAGYMAQPDAGQLRQIAELIDAGKVRVTVSKTFSLADAPAAIEAVAKGHTIGKIVVTVG